LRCVTFLSGDIVDKILPNLMDTSRTRRQVVRQLILMDLVTDSKQLKKGISGRSVTWREDEEQQLRDLYDMHQDDEGKCRLPLLTERVVNTCKISGITQWL